MIGDITLLIYYWFIFWLLVAQSMRSIDNRKEIEIKDYVRFTRFRVMTNKKKLTKKKRAINSNIFLNIINSFFKNHLTFKTSSVTPSWLPSNYFFFYLLPTRECFYHKLGYLFCWGDSSASERGDFLFEK